MRRLYAVIGWAVAALAATGVGVAALGVLGDGIVGEAAPPMTRADVRRDLARATTTARPSPPATTRGPARPAEVSGPVVLGGPGGTVVARCYADATVALDSWSPRQGFQVEDAERGPSTAVEIQFESDDIEVKGNVTCVNDRPVAHWKRED